MKIGQFFVMHFQLMQDQIHIFLIQELIVHSNDEFLIMLFVLHTDAAQGQQMLSDHGQTRLATTEKSLKFQTIRGRKKKLLVPIRADFDS